MRQLLGIYVGGETKTGKGAAGQHIAEILEEKGFKVYYDVGGDFFRRYTAMVRLELGLNEEDSLPLGEVLGNTAQKLYESGRCFEKQETLGDLQRPAISNSVSALSELKLVQQAGEEWYVATAKNAWNDGADVLVLDGRNPRTKMAEEKLGEANLKTAFDLYMTCEPKEAARRTLLALGISNPSDDQIADEEVKVIKRRDLDLHRAVNPFKKPQVFESFVAGESRAVEVIEASWQPHGEADLPVAIVLDNSHISKPDMLSAVAELASEAINFILDK